MFSTQRRPTTGRSEPASANRRRQQKRIFDGRGVVLRAPPHHFEPTALVKFQRREIRSAYFQQRFFRVQPGGPRHSHTQKRAADSAPPYIRAHRKIQNFNIAANAPGHQESRNIVRPSGYPSRHLAFGHAVVVPQSPLCYFRAGRLNCEDELQVAGLNRANVQDPAEPFQ